MAMTIAVISVRTPKIAMTNRLAFARRSELSRFAMESPVIWVLWPLAKAALDGRMFEKKAPIASNNALSATEEFFRSILRPGIDTPQRNIATFSQHFQPRPPHPNIILERESCIHIATRLINSGLMHS
jgi:hypothetical protein